MATGRPKGSKNGERIKSAAVQRCKSELSEMTVDELLVVRHLATERLAAINADGSETLEVRTMLALTEADLCFREERGTGHLKVTDYRRLKPTWGPSVGTILRQHKSWKRALAAHGMLGGPQPEYHLAIHDGRPKGGGRSWTIDDRVRSVAKCFERFGGRRPSRAAYDDFRRACATELPDANTVVGRTDKGVEFSWQEMCDKAVAHILDAGPSLFPRAYDFLSRARAIATGIE